ncbi:PCRF domain-containing protein, partial [bacterium]
MLEKLAEVERRFESVDADLANPAVASDPKELKRLGRLRAELEPIVDTVRQYRSVLEELSGAEELLADPEMREMAQGEIEPLRTRRDELEARLKTLLVPKDPLDDKAVIVEIRPAAGGAEAALFAAELFRMYTRYSERRGWRVEVNDLE